ncbi:MAG TPA: hypothetical protein VMB78_09755, partial [Dissulfurispiraceae bacterium]|nr:hypothetical protein [Dissulfurispiraceae bacterium]
MELAENHKTSLSLRKNTACHGIHESIISLSPDRINSKKGIGRRQGILDEPMIVGYIKILHLSCGIIIAEDYMSAEQRKICYVVGHKNPDTDSTCAAI